MDNSHEPGCTYISDINFAEEIMNSIWTESVQLPCFETLESSTKTDVLIIGGGIAGILCAYFFHEQGIYEKLLKNEGLERAKMYLNANQRALNKYYELCREIDCDFEEKPAFVYSLNDRKKLEKEADALRKIGFNADVTQTPELPFETVGVVRFEKQAQFHPLKFVARIVKNLRIYEHTFVKELKYKTAVTEKAVEDGVWYELLRRSIILFRKKNTIGLPRSV